MTRRLDIELTSARDDGSWTWRVAGALKPRGVIDSKLLEETAKVGDVLRVEAQVELEGITVVSVVPSRERVEPKDRIEIAPLHQRRGRNGHHVPGRTSWSRRCWRSATRRRARASPPGRRDRRHRAGRPRLAVTPHRPNAPNGGRRVRHDRRPAAGPRLGHPLAASPATLHAESVKPQVRVVQPPPESAGRTLAPSASPTAPPTGTSTSPPCRLNSV